MLIIGHRPVNNIDWLIGVSRHNQQQYIVYKYRFKIVNYKSKIIQKLVDNIYNLA